MRAELREAGNPSVAELRRLVRRVIASDFPSFVRKCFHELNPDTQFANNWHLDAIAHHLEQVRSGAIRRLIITMPPRSLKSISASVAFPAFIHGHDPTREVICVSYAQDLAAKLHNDYRTILGSGWYREAFPDTRISPRKDTDAETLLTERGSRLATSVGGVLTGRGADYIIIDDPLKPQDAFSETKRLAVNAWFGSTLVSRLNDKNTGAIVIVTQRLHVDDLVGHVLELSGEDWTVLNLPAIAPRDTIIEIAPRRFHTFRQGEVLHEDRESLAILENMRRDLGSDLFSAQYLQEPVPAGGNMFRRSWVEEERYDRLPEYEKFEVIQSWDTASKTRPENDWSVCTTWFVTNGNYYLSDVFRDRLTYADLRRKALELARKYDPRLVLVEDTNIGTALAVDLKAAGVRTSAVKVSQGKEARASVEAAKFEGGLVHLPRKAHWLSEYEAELFAFPNGRHDDQVDSTSQALAYDLRANRGGARPVIV